MKDVNEVITTRLSAERIPYRSDEMGSAVFVVKVPVGNGLEIGVTVDSGFCTTLYDAHGTNDEFWGWIEDAGTHYLPTLDAVVSVIRDVTATPDKATGVETFKRYTH